MSNNPPIAVIPRSAYTFSIEHAMLEHYLRYRGLITTSDDETPFQLIWLTLLGLEETKEFVKPRGHLTRYVNP